MSTNPLHCWMRSSRSCTLGVLSGHGFHFLRDTWKHLYDLEQGRIVTPNEYLKQLNKHVDVVTYSDRDLATTLEDGWRRNLSDMTRPPTNKRRKAKRPQNPDTLQLCSCVSFQLTKMDTADWSEIPKINSYTLMTNIQNSGDCTMLNLKSSSTIRRTSQDRW